MLAKANMDMIMTIIFAENNGIDIALIIKPTVTICFSHKKSKGYKLYT